MSYVRYQAASFAGGSNGIILVLTHLESPLPDRHGGSKGGLQAGGVRDRDPKILAAAPPALHQPVPVYPSEGTHIGDACSSQEYVPCSTSEKPYSKVQVKGHMEMMLAIARVVSCITKQSQANPHG